METSLDYAGINFTIENIDGATEALRKHLSEDSEARAFFRIDDETVETGGLIQLLSACGYSSLCTDHDETPATFSPNVYAFTQLWSDEHSDKHLRVIAPFVATGSTVTFVSHLDVWRYIFQDGTVYRQTPIWDDCE